MIAASRRTRWLRFSLRTLFLVVTALAMPLGWLGWNWRLVRERQSVRQRIEQAGGAFDLRVSGDSFFINPGRNPMPFPRNWLGDRREAGIVVPDRFADDEIADIRDAFPEAWVHCVGE